MSRAMPATKYLSLHGYRCAYMLVPAGERDELADLHLNMHGDVPLSDRLFVHRVCELMAGEGNRALVQHMRQGYQRLLDAGALGDHIAIETGYFLFGEISEPHERFLCLYAPSFELDGHPSYVRVNVLNSAAVDALIAHA